MKRNSKKVLRRICSILLHLGRSRCLCKVCPRERSLFYYQIIRARQNISSAIALVNGALSQDMVGLLSSILAQVKWNGDVSKIREALNTISEFLLLLSSSEKEFSVSAHLMIAAIFLNKACETLFWCNWDKHFL